MILQRDARGKPIAFTSLDISAKPPARSLAAFGAADDPQVNRALHHAAAAFLRALVTPGPATVSGGVNTSLFEK
jgi:hypothetical protein